MTPPEAKICGRCRREPAAKGQGHCKACHRVAMQEFRRRRRASETEAQSGATQKARRDPGENLHPVSPNGDLPTFIPFLGRPDTPREAWAEPYLCALAANGRHELAAAAAGVHSSIPRQQRDTDPAFAAEWDLAREFYRDALESELRRMGVARFNPLPHFGLLKSERPERWIERSASINLVADLAPLPIADAVILLRAMLSHATPETRRMLAGTPPEAARQSEAP
jgi:hypothetical protein